jgi:hypothetical protein
MSGEVRLRRLHGLGRLDVLADDPSAYAELELRIVFDVRDAADIIEAGAERL